MSAILFTLQCVEIIKRNDILVQRKLTTPVHAKLFTGNKNMYLHFMSFLHIDMAQVVEILPQASQELT